MREHKHDACHAHLAGRGGKTNKNQGLKQHIWGDLDAAGLAWREFRALAESPIAPLVLWNRERSVSWNSCCAFTESRDEKKADEGASACRRGDSDEVRSLALHSYVSLTHSIEEIYADSGGGR